MEKIIQRAIEGEWQPKEFTKNWVLNVGNRTFLLDSPFDDPLFWKALGKSCGWEETRHELATGWQDNAMSFHEINLTQGFDSAVAWLSDLVDKS